ncbi:MAG: hypothetical protein AB7O59_06125 [Pirellulales bacterium]
MNRCTAILWLVVLALSGCADIAVPRILHPGSEEYQQVRAEQFDPYPLPDVGPEIVGGRPLQYIKPAPWAERVQSDLTYEERFHQPAPPGLYKPSRATGSRQGVVYPVPGAQPLNVQPLVVPPGAAPGMAPPASGAPGLAPPIGGAPGVVPLPQNAAPPFAPQAAQKWRPVG